MTPEKLIQRIGILLILTFLFEVIRSFQMFEVVLLSLEEEFKFNLVLSVFVTLLLPVAGVLMWYKKKLGWTLAAVYLLITVAGAVWFMFIEFITPEPEDGFITSIAPVDNTSGNLFSILFNGAILYLLFKKSIRDVLQIDQKTINTVGVISAVILFILIAQF
jgi:hypothetical protein